MEQLPADPARETELSRVLELYTAAEDTGSKALRDDLIERHPELADSLRAFFADEDERTIAGHTRGPSPETAGAEGLGSSRRLVAGSTFGDYELLEEIGRGGMGVVFKARQRGLDRIVALKMILAGPLASDEEIRRFVAEAEAAGHLDHPGIVPVYEIGDLEGLHYFSMGFVEGRTLSSRLEEGPLPPRQAAEILLSVADAVAHAHRHGVVHRDLKPANVLIDAEGRTRITDFGLAKRGGDSQLTVAGQVLGTPSYMAPEQAAGDVAEVGPAADVYALGALLYALMTGHPPFRAPSTAETLRLVQEAEPVAPSSLQPTVPRDLETICLACLAKSPAARYASVDAVAADLRHFLAGEPIVARPVSALERAWRWCRRNPAVAGLGLTLALALVAGTTISTLFAVRSNREAAAAREAEGVARRQEYDARALLLQASWERGDMRLFGNLLEAQRPRPGQPDLRDLRGFEWHYWANVADRGQHTLGEHPEPQRSVAFSPDGTLLAAGGGGFRGPGEVSLFELPDETLLRTWKVGSRANDVAFSPSGRQLAVATGFGGRANRATLIDLDTGDEVLVAPHERTVWGVAFSPDGRRLATASGAFYSGGEVQVWDLASRRLVRTHPLDAMAFRVAYSPDGKLLAVAGGDFEKPGLLRLWRAENGREARTFDIDVHFAFDLDFDSTGERLAAAVGEWSGTPGEVRVWETGAGRLLPIRLRGHASRVVGVDISPDDTRIATAGIDRTVRIWDARTGREIHTLRAHTELLSGVRYRPDGLRVASVSDDRTLRLWDAVRGQKALTVGLGDALPQKLAVSPDDQWVAVAAALPDETGRLELRSVANGAARWTLDTDAALWSVAVDPAGRFLVTGDVAGSIRFVDPEGAPAGDPGPELPPPVHSLAVAPQGDLIAAVGGFRPSTLVVWNRVTGETVFESHDVADVRDIAFSRDGRLLLWASWDFHGQGDIADEVEYPEPPSPWTGRVRIRELATGQERELDQGEVLPIALALSHDGERVATGNVDRTLRIWDLERATELQVLRGHAGRVQGLAYAPDDSRLVSAGQDATLRLWDAISAQEVLTLSEHESYTGPLAFTPDGRTIVSSSEDHTIKIWDGSPSGD